jgi:hypothetical protein
MRPDERKLLLWVFAGNWPRDCPDIHPNRIAYLCDKWSRKGWYEYGVTVDLGWLLPDGKAKAQQLSTT